jgi:methylation protein EvaC
MPNMQKQLRTILHFVKCPSITLSPATRLQKEYFFEWPPAFSGCNMVQYRPAEQGKCVSEHNASFPLLGVYEAHFKNLPSCNGECRKPDLCYGKSGQCGNMLQNFAKAKIRHLGIEPSANVAIVAIDNGITPSPNFLM